MKIRSMAVLAAALLIAADDPKSDAVKAEMKKLEGTWKQVSVTSDGKKWPDEKAAAITFTIKADGTWAMKNETDSWHGTFTVDPTKTPKTGNFAVLSGKNKGQTTLDIYELDGETLKTCYVLVPTGKEATRDRPTKFGSEPGSKQILSVFKREKAK